MRDITYVPHSDCEKAMSFVEGLFNDPMTRAMGAPMKEIIQGWLGAHLDSCELCKLATTEANMP